MIVGGLTACQFGTNTIIVLMFVESSLRYVTKTWNGVLLNKKIHILQSQVYYLWQVVKTPTIISNNRVYYTTVSYRPKNVFMSNACVLLRIQVGGMI